MKSQNTGWVRDIKPKMPLEDVAFALKEVRSPERHEEGTRGRSCCTYILRWKERDPVHKARESPATGEEER
jgi:hypothetical protein